MPFSEVSVDARALADRLAQVPVGEVVTYGDLSTAIGRNILSSRWLIYSACKIVQDETGAVFVSERGVGYKRLATNDIPLTVGASTRAKVRSSSRRARRAIEAGIARANDLSPEAQRRAAAEISTLGLLEMLAKDRMMKPDENAPLKPEPVAVTARRFLERIGG